MTADPRTGSEASDLGRFEPSPYDFGITDNPEPVSYSLTAAAEAALPGFREIEAAFAAAEEDYGPQLQVPTSDTVPQRHFPGVSCGTGPTTRTQERTDDREQ